MSLKIEEAKFLLNDIISEWDQFSIHLQNLKKEELAADLFSQLSYLTNLEDMMGKISVQLTQLENLLQEINQMEKSSFSKEQHDQSNWLNFESEQVLRRIQRKLEVAEEASRELEEEALSLSQDLINDLVHKLLVQPQRGPYLNEELNLELDDESKLRELQDSLETYKEIRLESRGEADDPLLDQLDSQILSCDAALRINNAGL